MEHTRKITFVDLLKEHAERDNLTAKQTKKLADFAFQVLAEEISIDELVEYFETIDRGYTIQG